MGAPATYLLQPLHEGMQGSALSWEPSRLAVAADLGTGNELLVLFIVVPS